MEHGRANAALCRLLAKAVGSLDQETLGVLVEPVDAENSPTGHATPVPPSPQYPPGFLYWCC